MLLALQVVSAGDARATHMTMKLLTIIFFLGNGLLAFGGEISDYYAREHPEATSHGLAARERSRSHEQVESTAHGITEIGIERGACFGTCPIYTFIIKSDGTCRYKGGKYVEYLGEFSGTIPIWYFHELARFIHDADYMGFEHEYSRTVTDHATTYTTVVMNGKRKVISNYANAGPTTLWAIEQLIDSLRTKVKWSGAQKLEEQKK